MMDDLEGFSSEEDETRAWRVSKSGRKRDLTDFSHSTFSREDQNKKRVRTRSLRTRWASSGNATTTMWKQYRLPPEAHHSFGDHGITSVKGALCTYDDTTRRTMMSDLEDLEESTATTNSTSNQVKHTRSNTAAGTTGATGITSNIQLKRKGDNCGQGNHTMLLDDARVEDPESDTFLFSRPATLPSTLPRKKKRRSFPSSFDSSINRKYFIMDVETPFFAVLEALQPASCGEDHRDSTEFPHISTAHDHALPQAARVLELPAISLFGVWVAELHKRDTTTRMAAEDITSLGSSILLLRHHSHATLSSLKCYHQEAIVPDTLAISAIHPQLSRQTQIDSQHIRPADEINHKKSDRNFFISSISIAGFQGFTCSTDFNMNATRVGASILEGLEEDRPSRSEQAVFPALQSIAGATRPIGISVLCDFDMTCDYTIWIGQDLTLQSTPIVAIDVVLSDTTKSLAANKLYVSSKEDKAIQELSELNVRAHTQSVGLTGYDPFELLWKHNPSNYPPKTAMKDADVHLPGITPHQQIRTNGAIMAQHTTVEDTSPNTPRASPDSLGPVDLPPQKSMAKPYIERKLEGEQIMVMKSHCINDSEASTKQINGEESNLYIKKTDALEKKALMQPGAISNTKLTTMEAKHANITSQVSIPTDAYLERLQHQPTKKNKSVAEFFREQLPVAYAVRRRQSDTTKRRTSKVQCHKSLSKIPPRTSAHVTQEDIIDCSMPSLQRNATRGQRPVMSSRFSLSMLFFAIWALFTWKTTITPSVFLSTPKHTMGISTSSSLSSLCGRPLFPSIHHTSL